LVRDGKFLDALFPEVSTREWIIDDLTSVERLSASISRLDIDVVCHAAWSGHPRTPIRIIPNECSPTSRQVSNVLLAASLERPPTRLHLLGRRTS